MEVTKGIVKELIGLNMRCAWYRACTHALLWVVRFMVAGLVVWVFFGVGR